MEDHTFQNTWTTQIRLEVLKAEGHPLSGWIREEEGSGCAHCTKSEIVKRTNKKKSKKKKKTVVVARIPVEGN